MLVSPRSHAAPTFTVVDSTDAPDAVEHDGICASTHLGLCTLRAAIQEADWQGGTVVLTTTGTGPYQLTIPPGAEGSTAVPWTNRAGDLDIWTSVTVNGDGVDRTVIDGMGVNRIFDVHPGGTLQLNNLTLQDGRGDLDGVSSHMHGGAIHNHGKIYLFDVVVTDSITSGGWGGGGITNAGFVPPGPGETDPRNGLAQLLNVTISGNSTSLEGGGIENKGLLRMLNVTITQNTAPTGKGGGIYSELAVNPAATLVANNNGGDCWIAAGTVSASPNTSNLAGDGTCHFTGPNDRSGDPGFDTTAPGPPLFYPLLAGSQAVDSGVTCFQSDIRGASRAQDGNGDGIARCDTGSYERDTTLPQLSVADAQRREGNSGTPKMLFIVTLTPATTQPVKVAVATANGTARSGSDYKAQHATMIFQPGSRVKKFWVTLIPDRIKEKNETFKVKLSALTGATIGRAPAVGTILDDD
jgi:predicted outer membrane repeat protein